MAWNYMQLEIVPADLMVKPMIGPGGLTREEAHAEIQSILDRATRVNSMFRQVADTWRRGAKDDTVFAGPFTWAIYEHDADEGPRAAAMVWLEDYAATIHSAGLNVQTPKLPD